MVYTLRFFSLQNAVCFIIVTYLVPVLFTLYIQGVLKLKKKNSGTKKIKVYWGLEAQLHTTLAQDGGKWSASHPASLPIE